VAVLEAGRRRRVERLAAALGTLDADDLRLLTAAAELVETALERDRATRESDAAFHGVGSGEREP
jgi:GAF domain-containing protein